MNRKILSFILLLSITALRAQTSKMALADSLHSVGNYAEAIELLQSLEVTTENTLIKMARSYEAIGSYPEALKSYREVLFRNPEKILTAVDYARVLKKTGELEKADSIYAILSQKFPENANFMYQRGLIKEKQKDTSAINYFRNTILRDSTHRAANYKVAKKLLSNRKFVRAHWVSQHALSFHPNDAPLTSILAQALYFQGLYAEAIIQFEKLVSWGEVSEFVHSKLGYAYFKEHELDKAIKNYNLALDFNGRDPEIHYLLGKLYALEGKYENSEGHLLTAILLKKQPLDAEYLSLGLTYKLQKQSEKALRYFNLAIEEDPENERAWYERAIAADNYFKDLQTRQQFYRDYLKRFENSGNHGLVLLAKQRLSDIIKEQHLD